MAFGVETAQVEAGDTRRAVGHLRGLIYEHVGQQVDDFFDEEYVKKYLAIAANRGLLRGRLARVVVFEASGRAEHQFHV